MGGRGVGVNVSYSKSVHHPITTHGNREHSVNFKTNQSNSQISKLSFQLSVQVYSLELKPN